MNLVDSFRRKDKVRNVSFRDVKSIVKIARGKDKFSGLHLQDSVEPQIVIRNADQYFPFSSPSPFDIGWEAMPLKLKGAEIITVRYSANGETYFISEYKLDQPYTRLHLSPIERSNTDISIHYSGKKGLALLIHKILDRQEFIGQCLGSGVEVGPSFSPQLFDSSLVNVKYIEPDSVETLKETVTQAPQYKHLTKLFPRYHQGFADSIPLGDNTLDFIFSSHLFEHLANPLGHLVYWGSKLKEGGTIYAVVPDVRGCKDYVFKPSCIGEIVEEYRNGSLDPTIKHYRRWAEKRRPKGDDPYKYLKVRHSIHMHFYTKSNIEEVLSYAVENLGFSKYELTHTLNHKDFYFALTKK